MKGEEVGKILTSHATRQADVITDAAKISLKTDLKHADGKPIEIHMDTPLMKAASAMAVERGWTNGDLKAVTELVIKSQLAAVESEQKEFLALGAGDLAKANARYNAVLAAGAARLGADEQGKPTPEAEKAMAQIIDALSTKEEFELLEKLIGADGPGAAEAGGRGAATKDIATSWYGKDGLSGPGMKKAS